MINSSSRVVEDDTARAVPEHLDYCGRGLLPPEIQIRIAEDTFHKGLALATFLY